MAFKIETGIEIPKKQPEGLAKDIVETMKLMKIGDSFLVPYQLEGVMTKEAQEKHKANRVAYVRLVIKENKLLTEEFKSARLENGVRIWKVEPKKQ